MWKMCIAHADCNIKLKSNKKVQILFHNLNNFDAHLIMLDLGKFYFEVNVILNKFEKDI